MADQIECARGEAKMDEVCGGDDESVKIHMRTKAVRMAVQRVFLG